MFKTHVRDLFIPGIGAGTRAGTETKSKITAQVLIVAKWYGFGSSGSGSATLAVTNEIMNQIVKIFSNALLGTIPTESLIWSCRPSCVYTGVLHTVPTYTYSCDNNMCSNAILHFSCLHESRIVSKFSGSAKLACKTVIVKDDGHGMPLRTGTLYNINYLQFLYPHRNVILMVTSLMKNMLLDIWTI
jgi:hypothetical protein